MGSVFKVKRTVSWFLSGTLAAATVFAGPLSGAVATSPVNVAQAQSVVAVPMHVTKGVQKLVKLLPELSSRYVVYGGDVDGPGVSGVVVTFAQSAAEAESSMDDAIFDGQTGELLRLNLTPKAATKPAYPTEQQAKTRALAFVAGLQGTGNTYQTREVYKNKDLLTVRLVRVLNNVVLDDDYDCLVSFDAAGRIVWFSTFDGRLYEKVSPSSLPSPQRVISSEQAVRKWQESRPLELVYLLPIRNQSDQVEAKLAYVLKNGIITQQHTGSALDAFSGKRLVTKNTQATTTPSQTIHVTGTGEKWVAQTETQARDLLRMLFRIETEKLPLSIYEASYDDGRAIRYFIWGNFDEGVPDAEKITRMTAFPEGSSNGEQRHLLVTDAKTGELLEFSTRVNNPQWSNVKTDKKRDRMEADKLLKRLTPSGRNQIQITEDGDERYTSLIADPLVNGIPVYGINQSVEQGMYTIRIDSWTGTWDQVSINKPASVKYPARSQALKEQVAMTRLLQTFPLELTYIHQPDYKKDTITWKLGYDLSFRQTRSHCFCGGAFKVDDTFYVDAITGKVIVNE
ncbi:hypothetical protein DES34_11923 [Brevibacillus brevis]|nr:hypothetical protein C7J99_26035 [Brevibacillus brevis]RED21596.1 hypothetical protein DES34_11923 [Brevibacillus brevis]GEC91843.1 hypothetical protein BBR01nite_41740 [Brevibacillus brevis]VEF86730.1 Uncharacterised protein [Brevibacillus brevis]